MPALFGLLNLGGAEIILILAVILLLFGAKKLPELAKGLGQGIKEFKKATHSASQEIGEAMAESPATVPRRLPPAAIAPTDLESLVSHGPTAQ